MPTPLPVLPGVYYGHLFGTFAGLPTGNIFAFKTDLNPGSVAEDVSWAQIIATALTTEWVTTVGPLFHAAVVGYDSRVYPLGSPAMPALTAHTSGGGAGTGPSAPVSAALIMRHTVLRRGRGSQSHSAFSPLGAGSISDDGKSPTPGNITAFTEEFDNFIGQVQGVFAAAVPGVGLGYVQVSKKGSGATYPIVASAAESLLGTERSRTPRP
jgi:hypothetical protein